MFRNKYTPLRKPLETLRRRVDPEISFIEFEPSFALELSSQQEYYMFKQFSLHDIKRETVVLKTRCICLPGMIRKMYLSMHHRINFLQSLIARKIKENKLY